MDGTDGPAIFWNLAGLKGGDQIFITASDGQLVFGVYGMELVTPDLADVDALFGYRFSLPSFLSIGMKEAKSAWKVNRLFRKVFMLHRKVF